MKRSNSHWGKAALVCAMLFASAQALSAQAPAQSATERMQAGVASLMTHYDAQRGLWDTEGWWNGANSTTEIGLAAAVDPAASYPDTLKTTFENAPHKFQNFRNEFYDDEGWWALAWIQAYDVTHREAYLKMAESIFSDMSGGWDKTCGGGIWWKKDRHYKNAIANELFLSVAAHLAARTDGKKQAQYTDWAQREWTWFAGSGMINDKNLINDGLTPACKNNGRQTWTYNQGVVLGGLTALAKVSNDPSLLAKANTFAHAAIAHLSDSKGVLHDWTEPKCSGDTVQFKGIFVRNLAELNKASPDETYKASIQANADAVWTDARTDANEFACRWTGPAIDGGAGATTSALGPLVAAAGLEKESQ
jgi:predicted alpha-1,6-mannanase (GH76 family)